MNLKVSIDFFTKEFFLDNLFYDKDNGKLFWKKTIGKAKDGAEVGNINKGGYRYFCIQQKFFYTHRVIWFLENGSWPSNLIDHIDCNKCNNVINNLRNSLPHENSQNIIRKSRFLKGVKHPKDYKKYMSVFMFNRKRINIGVFDTEIEAHLAYVSYVKNLNCEFIRTTN